MLLGATVAFAAMFTTANAQKAGGFNPTGQALTSEHAYEQYKLQYMAEHPELFGNQATNQSKYPAVKGFQATGDEAADNARYEAAKIAQVEGNNPDAEIKDFLKNKEAIYNQDPARYEAMVQKVNARQGASQQRVSQEEYNSMPATKKAYMDAHPEKYVIERSNR